MRTLIKNIKRLVQVEYQPKLRVCGKEMAQMETLENAYLIIEDEKIAAFGKMDELKEQVFDKEIDARGRMVLPSTVPNVCRKPPNSNSTTMPWRASTPSSATAPAR